MTGRFEIPSPGMPLTYGEVGAPLVVLVHDFYGRLPWIENYADVLSREGFRVVVPDLFDGQATTEVGVAESLMRDLDVATALTQLDDVIQSERDQGAPRAGVVGFSLGGWLTLLHAQGGAVDAVVAYYATLDVSQHGVIPCPVLLQLAEKDEWGDGEDPESFVTRLKDHGTPVTTKTYIGTVHSFANASIHHTFDANAAALAFARTTTFLEAQLDD